MPIHILDDQVIAQIAAGEVIERPASVIKELVENALDAGATTIHIAVAGGGQRLMRVSDNGQGIPADQVETAFARHATSKLVSADDLSHIQTLGFRGEALASIASISRVTMTTRAHDEAVGTRLHLEGGRMMQRQPTGAPAGTVIAVENLFFNTPARLKFQKAENTEKRQIALVVGRYAMAYPQVRFILEQDGREAFRSSGSGQLADVLIAALGVTSFKDLIEIESENSDRRSPIKVWGYTSVPGQSRADRSRIILFVNGRWIQDASLGYAVVQAYHTFLMKGRYPVSVVMIELPSEEVDVNVHPTKAEVRFQNPNAVFAIVQRTIRRAILDLGQTTPLHEGHGLSMLAPASSSQFHSQTEMDFDLDSPGWYPHQQPSYTQHAADEEDAIPAGLEAPNRPRTLPLLRVVGQVGASYIVAEGPAGLYLIDQHAAHERILYEQFMENHTRQEQIAQLTLSAQTIELPASEAALVEANFEVLDEIGFKLEPFGQNTFVIRSIPSLLSDRDPVQVVAEVVQELEADRMPGQAQIEEKIIQRVCKQAAVKAGTILSMEQMQALIRQLERTESPLTCPHGRPTMLHMTSEQLEREFGRK
ncbi:MAG: DNA mismatch repair endonuclease MutL [Anaerolineae bacterium]|nr:DNA mismatch repair endonuclease MutL [Anaerolineae bacterium]